jgi:hypothetical protein
MTKLSKLDVFESNRLDGLANCSGGYYTDTYQGGKLTDVFHDKFTTNSTLFIGSEAHRGDLYNL